MRTWPQEVECRPRRGAGPGYLLKDRVSDVRRFIEAVRTVADGGIAMDPEVVSQLLARHARDELLSRLPPENARYSR